jgi:hypothetical protein
MGGIIGMKIRRIDFALLLIMFIMSTILVSYALAQFFYSFSGSKSAFESANISKKDVMLTFYGKSIPEKKIKIYNKNVKATGKMINSKNNLSDTIKGSILVVIPSIFITSFIYAVYSAVRKEKERSNEKKAYIENDGRMKQQYIGKYGLEGKDNIVYCIDGQGYDSILTGKSLVVWKDNKYLNLINSSYKEDIGLFKINLDKLYCFSRYGDFYTTLSVSGGDTSFGGAAIGYALAGGVGAILASRNPIKGETTVHDNRETIIIFYDDYTLKYIFFEPKFYDYLMHTIPNKEINHKTNQLQNLDSYDKVYKLKELSHLKEKGHITEDEFSKLKKELI